jgi:serine/threonine protein kinase
MSATPGHPPIPFTAGAGAGVSLADLVDEITRAMESGEAGEASALSTALIQAHPEHADELRRLMPTLRMLADWGQSVNGVASATPSSVGHSGHTSTGAVSGLLGDFRIIRAIGRGGMGVVYEAEQISLGRRVALKVLPFASTMDPKQLQRFQNEARSAASLHHPHIVPVYAVGCERGVHYFAMQYIDGPTLAECIRNAGRPANSEVTSGGSTLVGRQSTLGDADGRTDFRKGARIGIQAARGLEHAHTVGVVHRDIKPSNLLLDAGGDVWIADFGLARSRNQNLTTTGDLVGTLRYMSPEQALAQHDLVDHRTDIYSLGASLYELLTRTPAIDGEDSAAMMRQILHGQPKPLRGIDPAIPVPLETIVLKAMASEPAHRYPTAAELADDLQRFVDDVPIRAKRLSVAQRVGRWTRKHRTATWLAVASALVVSAIVSTTFAVSRERIRRSLDSEITANRDLAVSLERERDVQSRLRIALAQSAWAGNRPDEARRSLDECPPEHRGAEWRTLDDLVSAMIGIVRVPDQSFQICLAHDDRKVAYSNLKTVTVCDLETGGIIAEFPVAQYVVGMAFTRDSQKLVLLQSPNGDLVPSQGVPGIRTGQISVWDWQRGTPLIAREYQYDASQQTLSPDGERYAVNRIGKTVVRDTMTGDVVVELHNPLNRSAISSSRILFARNGRRIGASMTQNILLWDVPAGGFGNGSGGLSGDPAKPETIPTKSLRETISDFSEDGERMLVTGTRREADNTSRNFVKLHDLPGRAMLWQIESSDSINASAISRDGRRIAYLVLDRIELLDAADGRSLATLRGHTNLIRKVWFSRDGKRLFTSARDNTLRIWNLTPWNAP